MERAGATWLMLLPRDLKKCSNLILHASVYPAFSNSYSAVVVLRQQ